MSLFAFAVLSSSPQHPVEFRFIIDAIITHKNQKKAIVSDCFSLCVI